MVLTSIIYDELVQSSALCRHGRKRHKTIAPVDVQTVRHRSDDMRRVDVAIAMHGMVRTPLCLRIGGRSHAQLATRLISIVRTIVEFHIAQVMLIATSGMKQLAEQPLAHHVEGGHAIPTIANILHDVQVAACRLRYIHQIPALLQRVSGRHLHAHIRHTGLHRRY